MICARALVAEEEEGRAFHGRSLGLGAREVWKPPT